MKAIVIREPGGPDVLELRDVDDPVPAAGEILVRVAGTAVNRADLLQRRGHYPAPEGWPADIPGLEFAGTVERVGPGVDRWTAGDRVMGLVGGGGYAELVAVRADHVARVPDSLDLTAAAGVPEVFITAHDALRTRLHLREGESLLIHAVGSGVGTAALQLAKAWGATVIGTARSGWKLDRARELGLDVAIETGEDVFADAVLDATDGRPVDAILDLVGAAYLEENLRVLATLGRLAVVGLPSGARSEIDLSTVLRKRLTIVGTALRSRSDAEKAEATRLFEEDVVPALGDGSIRPIIHETLPSREAARAHALVESNETYGKVVLTW